MKKKTCNSFLLTLLLLVLISIVTACASSVQKGALINAEKSYHKGQYHKALRNLSMAESYKEIPPNQKAYVTFLKALCLEGLQQKWEAVALYEYIITSFPKSEYAYRAKARLSVLKKDK